MTYAKGTGVSIEQSRLEIERLIHKAGATAYTYGLNADKAMVQFELRERVIRFVLPFPTLEQFQRVRHGGGWKATNEAQRERRREQAIKERWRALKIAIQAKLESMAAGIESFEEAFLAQIVDPATNRTVYEAVRPALITRYADHPKPIGLPAPEPQTSGKEAP